MFVIDPYSCAKECGWPFHYDALFLILFACNKMNSYCNAVLSRQDTLKLCIFLYLNFCCKCNSYILYKGQLFIGFSDHMTNFIIRSLYI